ncbi:hypothetical protein, partial [Pseudomonas sp. PS01297]|uniref:hypothetical protein n=1 Tax=Pseudomonas sp. PS01297 TaxID=2991433 RepID=UPI00249A95DC
MSVISAIRKKYLRSVADSKTPCDPKMAGRFVVTHVGAGLLAMQTTHSFCKAALSVSRASPLP